MPVIKKDPGDASDESDVFLGQLLAPLTDMRQELNEDPGIYQAKINLPRTPLITKR